MTIFKSTGGMFVRVLNGTEEVHISRWRNDLEIIALAYSRSVSHLCIKNGVEWKDWGKRRFEKQYIGDSDFVFLNI